MKILAIIFAGLGVPISVLGLALAALASGSRGGGSTAFWAIVVAIAPWAIAGFFWTKSKAIGRAEFNQFVSSNLTKVDFSDWFDASGIAIDLASRKIVLANKNKWKAYDFDDIREWKSSFQSGGSIQTFGNIGTTGHMQAAANNIGAAAGNYMASGLFIRVRDIDYPEWHIMGASKQQATRWFEILEQNLNERATIQ
jgi:hypothetical protein